MACHSTRFQVNLFALSFLLLCMTFMSCQTKTTTPDLPDVVAPDTITIRDTTVIIDTVVVIDTTLAIETGSKTISFSAANNAGLFKDIVFTMQADSSYVATVAHEVDLSRAVASFNYSGSVSFNGVPIQNAVTVISVPNDFIVSFNDKPVVFKVVREYTVPAMHIHTLDGTLIDTVYKASSIRIDGKNIYADYVGVDMEIRQRGNSTKIFYEKKPYRIKLGAKAALLGMQEDKDWVLLANYRDPTHMMNAVSFDMARYMNLPYTNTNRFVEVYVNNDYVGLYQLTEQVEQGPNRVAINNELGVLLSLDLDDGPELSPNALNNFYSTVYELPICIKHPKDPTLVQIEAIKTDFAIVENLIKTKNYSALASRLDIQSFIDFLIIQELTRNVELVSPRSMYMYKDADQIYHMGPVWDFDGGFAFDWASMTVGHNYFGSQSWLMGATNPSTHPRTAYDSIPGFFVDLFANRDFVNAYKTRWNVVKAGLLNDVFAKLDRYVLQTSTAMSNNAARWPIDKNYQTEHQRMKSWLTTRVNAYTAIVNGY